MTKEQLKAKTLEMIEEGQKRIIADIDRAIASGSMDIEGAEDGYGLPRILYTALLENEKMRWQCEADIWKKEVENIVTML